MAVMFLALIALMSCEIFDLRDSQLPTEEAKWHDFATNLELALENLEFAYEDSRNAVNYTRIFFDGFRFHFAPQDITDFSTDAEWSSAEEQDMLLNLHTRYSKISVDLQALETPDEISSNAATLYRAYQLIAKPVQAEADILVEGNLELHYRRQHGNWYLYRWYDYRSSEESTWGRLKHENS
jgi:hypothetical protein